MLQLPRSQKVLFNLMPFLANLLNLEVYTNFNLFEVPCNRMLEICVLNSILRFIFFLNRIDKIKKEEEPNLDSVFNQGGPG